ncbi:MAG: tetratricopeptide repeat protein [Bacteroidota bacterium]|nr:tetratricopeptide repeat protein [Bacteroidota bacterium]
MKFALILFLQLITLKIISNNDSISIVNYIDSASIQPNNYQANKYIKLAKQKAKKNSDLSDIYSYSLAKYYLKKGLLDSVIAICNNSLNNKNEGSNQLKYTKYYNILASAYAFKSNYKVAIKNYQKAIAILEKNKKHQLVGQINNNIANIFFSIFDYSQAFKYSQQSIKLLEETKDTMYLPAVYAVSAVSALKLDSLEIGKTLLKKSEFLSKRHKNILGYLLNNYAYGEYYTKTLKFDSAFFHFEKSLELSYKTKNKFYELINLLGLTELSITAKQPSLAKTYGLNALKIIVEINNENAMYSVVKNIGLAYHQLNKNDSAFYYCNMANDLLKRISAIENKKIVNDILIKYETSKKQNDLNQVKIKLLKSQNQIANNKFLIVTLIFICIILITVYLVSRNIHNRKLEFVKIKQEKELYLSSIDAEEKERERISNELHDGVLSTLTTLKLNLDNNNLLNEKLQEIHSQIRKIAHNLYPISFTKTILAETLQKFCSENSNNELSIDFYWSIKNNKDKNQLVLKTVYLIGQELIQNVIKHAKAKKCFVNLIFDDEKLLLSVEDDGIGFDFDKEIKNQGLESITKRVSNLNGKFDCISEENKGTICTINLPNIV